MSIAKKQITPNAFDSRHRHALNRRGATTAFGVILTGALMALTAFAVDFGHINVSRSEVKRAADSSALSAAWDLYDGTVAGNNTASIQDQIGSTAAFYAAANLVASNAPHLDTYSDIELGYYNPNNPGVLDQSNPDAFNAVRVHLRQNEANSSAIPLFFGAITGRYEQSMQATSTAAMYKAVSGFKTPPDASEMLNILPIALDLETWEQVVAKSTSDNLSFVNGAVESGSDGYCECSLYPTGTGAPGNRGTVDIGGAQNSTSDIARQILYGISQQDMADLGHSLEFDNNGELDLNGDTGLSAAIKDELRQIIGQPRIIPIFKQVGGNGDNATYTIVRWEGIRILGVKLTGPMEKKHVTIQPCPMVARHSTVDFGMTQESDFLYTPVMLVE